MTKEVATRKWDERMDDRLWKLVGTKTPAQIAKEFGVPASEVARRIRELLDSIDVLTIAQQRQKILIDVGRIARKAEAAFDEAIDERNKSGLLNSAMNAIKESLRQLAAMENRSSGEVDRLNELRVRELVRLVETAVADTVAELLPGRTEEAMDVFYGYLAANADAGA